MCNEPNCIRIHCDNLEQGVDEETTTWCMGVRTGVPKGKEVAVQNVPSDIFMMCTLIGAHSESHGRHCFVYNLNDYVLDLKHTLIGMYAAKMTHQIRQLFNILPDYIIKAIESECKRVLTRDRNTIVVGTKFIEFSCSCEEIFFRVYNHNTPDGEYHEVTLDDEQLFDYHRRLGHTVSYRKCKHVKRSRVGNNRYWQQWGPYELKEKRRT